MARVATSKKKSESENPGDILPGAGLKALRDRLSKAVKGVHISIMSDSKIAERNDYVETPSYDLNRILSGDLRKGIPKKTWTLFVAPEHAGKSSFIALIAAKAKQKYASKIIVIDTEGGWDTKFITRWGLDPEEVLYIYTPWIDEIKVILANLIEGEDENLIIILDSIGGIEKKKIKEDALKGDPKADQGTLQKELKPLYKMLANIVKTKDSIALSAGHYYGNPSGYGDADQIAGGKYLKLAVDITVAFKKAKLFDGDKNVIGNKLTATTMKNRMYPPFNEATIEIDFEHGINPYAGLMEIALEADILSNTGNTYIYIDSTGEERKAVGEKQVYTKLFGVYGEEIVDKITEYVKTTGFSTLNTLLQNECDELENEIAAGFPEKLVDDENNITDENA